MTEEEKKAIEVLKTFKEKGYAMLMVKYDKDRIATNTMLEMSIETIFNLIQNQQKEIELLKEQKQYVIDEYSKTIEQKDKMINNMSKYIDKNDESEIFCEGRIECNENCKDCVKEYFRKEAEKNE